MPSTGAAPSSSQVGDRDVAIERAVELARGGAAAAERGRALAPALLDELRATGLMRAGAPAALGALEAPPARTLSAAESIACGDASAGWCVSIAATSSLLSAYLPEGGAEEIFGDPLNVAAGVWAPMGKAVPANGGMRVSGRWSFCSGISHSEWLFAGCVLDDGRPAAGGPVLRVVGMPTAELEVLDTWHTSGLRGTGSHDALADERVRAGSPHALADGRRTAHRLAALPVPDIRLLRPLDRGGGARQRARSDRRPLRAGCREASPGIEPRPRRAPGDAGGRRARRRLSCARRAPSTTRRSNRHGARRRRMGRWRSRCASACGSRQRTPSEPQPTSLAAMYDLGGGTAIYEDSPLQRRFRDAHAATAHFQVNPATWELAGRLLLDLPTNTAQL